MVSADETASDLIARLRARDPQALAVLYDTHSKLLFGLVLRMLRNPRDAEEVLQDVFVQAWTRVGSYDPSRGSMAGWLVGIARHRAIDLLRADAVRLSAFAAAPLPASLDTPESLASQQERHRGVHRALDALPSEQRQLIERAYFRGSTQSELALQFDLPLGTVKTRIRTGLAALRGLLEDIALRP